MLFLIEDDTSTRHKAEVNIMEYQEKRHLHVTIDEDQYEWLGRIVDERRSSFSQVVRELISQLMKRQERELDEHLDCRLSIVDC